MEEKIRKKFPDYFSASVQRQILNFGREDEISVYRVAKYGKNDQEAFLNYYDEVLRGLKVVRGNKEAVLNKYRDSCDNLSISCYEDLNDIKDYFMLTLKDGFPGRILLLGKTSGECGLSCRTKLRKPKCADSHVDWWLYQDAEPWLFFQETEVK